MRLFNCVIACVLMSPSPFSYSRLWVRPKVAGESQTATQIGLMNVIPGIVSHGGTFSLPKFNTIAETVNSINEIFTANPLPGKVFWYWLSCHPYKNQEHTQSFVGSTPGSVCDSNGHYGVSMVCFRQDYKH